MCHLRIGDVCVIIDHPHLLPHQKQYVGLECTVRSLQYYDDWDVLYDAATITIPGHPEVRGARYVVLRPKRPPAWDEWLGDTSKVKDEEREEVVV